MMKPSDLDAVGNADPVAVKRATDNAEKDLLKVGVHEVSIESITVHVAIAFASEAKEAGWSVRTKATENGPVLVIEHPSFSTNQFGASSEAASNAIKSSKSRGTSISSGRINRELEDLGGAIRALEDAKDGAKGKS